MRDMQINISKPDSYIHSYINDHTHTRVTYLNKVIRTLFHFTKKPSVTDRGVPRSISRYHCLDLYTYPRHFIIRLMGEDMTRDEALETGPKNLRGPTVLRFERDPSN